MILVGDGQQCRLRQTRCLASWFCTTDPLPMAPKGPVLQGGPAPFFCSRSGAFFLIQAEQKHRGHADQKADGLHPVEAFAKHQEGHGRQQQQRAAVEQREEEDGGHHGRQVQVDHVAYHHADAVDAAAGVAAESSSAWGPLPCHSGGKGSCPGRTGRRPPWPPAKSRSAPGCNRNSPAPFASRPRNRCRAARRRSTGTSEAWPSFRPCTRWIGPRRRNISRAPRILSALRGSSQPARRTAPGSSSGR